MPETSEISDVLHAIFSVAVEPANETQRVGKIADSIITGGYDAFTVNAAAGRAYYRNALRLNKGQQYEISMNFLQKAQDLKPDDREITNDIGWCAYALAMASTENETALEYFRRAAENLSTVLDLYPNDADMKMMIGYACFKTGDMNRARALIEEALSYIHEDGYHEELKDIVRTGLMHMSAVTFDPAAPQTQFG